MRTLEAAMLARMVRCPRLPLPRIVHDPDPGPGWSDEPEPHALPTFISRNPLSENVFTLTRPLWGKAQAEWGLCLAWEVVARYPEAEGQQAPEWAAGILAAAGVEAGMRHEPDLWGQVVDDIALMTGVAAETVLSRWTWLDEAGMARPKRPPSYWID